MRRNTKKKEISTTHDHLWYSRCFFHFYCGSFHSHYFFLLFSFSKLSVFTNLRSLVNVCFISWWNASTKTKKNTLKLSNSVTMHPCKNVSSTCMVQAYKTMFSEKQEKREEKKNRKQAKWLTQLIYCLLMAANCSSFFQFFGRFNDY